MMKSIYSLVLLVLVVTSCLQKDTLNSKVINPMPDWTLSGFQKVDSLNPILTPSSSLEFTCPITQDVHKWEERNVLNPTAIVRNDSVYLFYRAQDENGTSRIGLAVSSDGLRFTKMKEPVFSPDNDHMKKYEWNYRKAQEDVESKDCYFCYFDGCEDPRIVESEDGRYFMTYTSYDGKTARLSIASSKDLYSWTKHGLVLGNEKYHDTWSKAGSIISRTENGRTIATKIDGKYWMYFGDTNLFMATSDNLEEWSVCENEESEERISVLHPRMGYFDSRLVEPGPAALIRDEGILLIYNGSNAANYNDPSLPKFTYAAGQALFDKEKPYRMIDRTESNFIRPDKDYERIGEVNEVCFVEGLVFFKDKWYLYYGTADSKIAVAVKG